MAKRIFDALVSVALLLGLAPLMILIACVVKITSRGPIIFKQERLGFQKKPFTIFKFRTMIDGSGKTIDVVLKGDKRVTKAGKYLRASYFDELPQLWNVLKGDMSLVGPRPYPTEKALLDLKTYPDYEKRFKLKPGMTGLAQVWGRVWILSNREAAHISGRPIHQAAKFSGRSAHLVAYDPHCFQRRRDLILLKA